MDEIMRHPPYHSFASVRAQDVPPQSEALPWDSPRSSPEPLSTSSGFVARTRNPCGLNTSGAAFTHLRQAMQGIEQNFFFAGLSTENCNRYALWTRREQGGSVCAGRSPHTFRIRRIFQDAQWQALGGFQSHRTDSFSHRNRVRYNRNGILCRPP